MSQKREVSPLSTLRIPVHKAGSPTKTALETVITSDARLAAVQKEVELLEADAEESATDQSGRASSPRHAKVTPSGHGNVTSPPPGGRGTTEADPRPPDPTSSSSRSKSSARSNPPSSGKARNGGGGGDGGGIEGLSVEEKAARLEEMYEELSLLVRGERDRSNAHPCSHRRRETPSQNALLLTIVRLNTLGNR